MRHTLVHTSNLTPIKMFMATLLAMAALLMSACGSDVSTGSDPIAVDSPQLVSADEPPTSGQRSVPLSFFTVELRDADDNVVFTEDGLEIDVALQSGEGTLSGTTTKVLENGMALFDDLSVDGAGGFTLVISTADAAHGTVVINLDVTEAPLPEEPYVPSDYSDGYLVATSMDERIAAFEVMDDNFKNQIYAHDRVAATTDMLSIAADGSGGDDESWDPSLSADGRFAAFESAASNLTTGSDSNGLYDVFVRDRHLGRTRRLSAPAGGEADGDSWGATISSDGRYIEFYSTATNLVPGYDSGWGRYRYDQVGKTLSVVDGGGGR